MNLKAELETMQDESRYWKECIESKLQRGQDNAGLRQENHRLQKQLRRAIDLMKVLRARLKLLNKTANHLIRFAEE